MSHVLRLGASEGAQKAFLAIPAYGPVHPQLAYALMATERELREAGISLDLEIYADHCHVDDCRNLLIRDFLETDATDLVFIDADVSWRPRDLIKLLGYDRDVVAGVYPYKSDRKDFPCRLIAGEIWSDEDGLIEVEGVPGGFLRIRRAALEKLAEVCESYRNAAELNRGIVPVIFERTLEKGVRYSGDYVFCKKWRALGGKVFVDPTLRFGHFGTKEWTGCFGDHLKHKAGLGFENLLKLKDGTADDDTLMRLYGEWDNEGFSGSLEFLETCLRLSKRASTILECGSGLSSLVMAAGSKAEIHALESDPAWHAKVTKIASRLGLDNLEVHLCPIVEYKEGRWYDVRGLALPLRFSMVVCDGPKRDEGWRGVLYHIMDAQMRDALVVMDDANDPVQTNALRAWAHLHGRSVQMVGVQRMFAVSQPKLMEAA